jgi:hypothetical protein
MAPHLEALTGFELLRVDLQSRDLPAQRTMAETTQDTEPFDDIQQQLELLSLG